MRKYLVAQFIPLMAHFFQEKFRKLEEKEKKGDADYRTKKIHVRSKDPGKIARQFEKGDRDGERTAGKGRKVGQGVMGNIVYNRGKGSEVKNDRHGVKVVDPDPDWIRIQRL
jgi:hypothetical protein